jgi:hypothetical protein
MEFFKLLIISHMNFLVDGNYIGQSNENTWHQLANEQMPCVLIRFGDKLNLIHQHRYLNIQNM